MASPQVPKPWTWTENGEAVRDPDDWRLWWEFNKDAYLDRRAAIERFASTSGPDLYLGSGEEPDAARSSLEGALEQFGIPALVRSIERGGKNDFVASAVLAMAKIGPGDGTGPRRRFEPYIRHFLTDGTAQSARAAVLALGLLGKEPSARELVSLLSDTSEGRELVARQWVDTDTRAFAAYGLGLFGKRTQDAALREEVVRALAEAAESRWIATEIRVAAMVGLALVPPSRERGADDCDCGGLYHPYETSRESQIARLAHVLADAAAEPAVLRAQAARTLAHVAADAPEDLRARAARALLAAVDRSLKESGQVRQSAVLALGRLADADEDEVDRDMRGALVHAVAHGDETSRRFALVALAQAASRAGSGEEPFAGTAEARATLLRELARGRQRTRPWAALALGVLGRALEDAGGQRSPAVDLALRQALERCRSEESAGAYALAMGLRRQDADALLLVEKLDQLQEESARGYVAPRARSLGRTAGLDALERIVREAEHSPELHTQAAIAYGLLVDRASVGRLVELWRASKDEARASLTIALGFAGHPLCVAALAELLDDPGADDRPRAVTALAIGTLADRHPRPWSLDFSADLNYRAGTPSLTSDDGWGVLDIR